VCCDYDVCNDCGADAAQDGANANGITAEKRAASEPVMILYTSGSTGAPKGAVISGSSFFAEVHPFVIVYVDREAPRLHPFDCWFVCSIAGASVCRNHRCVLTRISGVESPRQVFCERPTGGVLRTNHGR
jgi:acyl-CoA synthetase (AMP-forming)/AMP-acid ligase II